VDIRNCKIASIAIPFRELEACPECGRMELWKVHDQKYPDQNGIVRLVVYRCPNGHETHSRQIVVKKSNVPPKELWEGWY